MLNRLIELLCCPICFDKYQFNEIEVREVFEPSGVLECSKCGKSVIVIKGVPVFYRIFNDCNLALDAISLISREDPSTKPLIASLLRRTKESFQFGKLMSYLESESLSTIFKRFKTEYVNLERFNQHTYWGVQEFLADKPVERLLDIGCGFGCSTNPFLTNGKVRYVLGIDNCLFDLFLFQKYCQQYGFQNADFVCLNAANLPFPFKSDSFSLTIAINFFNHFPCLVRSRETINVFFQELERVTRNEGRIYIDSVPNRLNPFPKEVDVSAIITQGLLRQVTENLARTIPTKWIPGTLSMNVLWHIYKAYCRANSKIEFHEIFSQAVFSRETFFSYLSGEFPEINTNCLPIFPSVYRRFFSRFTRTKIMPQSRFYKDFHEKKWSFMDFFGSPYLIIDARSHKKRPATTSSFPRALFLEASQSNQLSARVGSTCPSDILGRIVQ
jgi:SAM-dependent methyltransferase/uncharacterized protein YbaR (Trm112 family)